MEAILIDKIQLKKNQLKHQRTLNGENRGVVLAKWPSGNSCNQVEALEDEEKEFEMLVAAYNQRCESLLAGFDDVPFATMDFGGVSWLMSLAYDCHMLKIDGRINSEPIILKAEDTWKIHRKERIFEYGLYPEIFRRIQKFQSIYPQIPLNIPDNQSPSDVLTCVIRSEEAMIGMFEEPEAIHYLMGIITESIIELNRYYQRRVANFGSFASGMYQPFGMHVFDDNAAFLSPNTYEKFAKPYVEKLSDEFGGIRFHCCMGYAQNLKTISSTRGFMGFDPQLDYNPIGKILEALGGTGGAWYVSNVPWQKNIDLPHDDEQMFKKVIDMTEGVCGLSLNVYGDTKEEALKLAYCVKEYLLKKQRA